MNNDELCKKLTDLGMLESEINKLVEAGVESEQDLALLSAQEIREWAECKPMVAFRVANAFKPQQAVTPPAPTEIILKKEQGPSNKEIFHNAAEGDTEAKAALKRLVGNLPVLVCDPETGQFDWEQSFACFSDYQSYGERQEIWDNRPTETWDMVFQDRQEAHPLSGKRLLPTSPWKNISIERRVLVSFGVLANLLPSTVDEYVILAELRQEFLGERWISIQNAYKRAKSADNDVYRNACKLLYVQKGSSSAHLSTSNVVAQVTSVVTTSQMVPSFGPAVYPDFRNLAMFYINGDKQSMLEFLITRAEFLEASDITSPADIKGVPLEAMVLLRAGVHNKIWIFQNRQSTLEAAYGLQPIIPYLGKPKDAFYQAIEQFCPSLAGWVGEILYHPSINSFYGRPRPNSMGNGRNWKGGQIVSWLDN